MDESAFLTHLQGSIKTTLRHSEKPGKIADFLERMIADMKLSGGSRLPTEQQFANAFMVNRTTLRSALRILEERGLISQRPGLGTFVNDLSNSMLAKSIVRFYTFGSCKVEDLLKVREILEPGVAEMAAASATEAQIRRIGEFAALTRELYYVAGKVDEFARADMMFHQSLAQATDNELIIAFMKGIQKVMHDRLTVQAADPLPYMDEVRNMHYRIYEAIEARDREMAGNLMRFHMEMAWKQHRLVDTPGVRAEKPAAKANGSVGKAAGMASGNKDSRPRRATRAASKTTVKKGG